MEGWLDCKQELCLCGTRLDVNTFAVNDKISYCATMYLGFFDVNLTTIAKKYNAYKSV
jgi:hypothetical protein